LHHLRWTRSEIYERFYDLEKKRRLRPDRIRWVHATMAQLLERYLCEGRELDFFAILGAMAARSSPDGERLGEKDYRQDGHRPGFENALRLFESIEVQTMAGDPQ